jgi:hypothetical protein
MSIQVEKMTNELFSKSEENHLMLLGREEKVREVKNGEEKGRNLLVMRQRKLENKCRHVHYMLNKSILTIKSKLD